MPRLWVQALPRIALGEAGEPQDEATATYFGNVADEAAWKTIDRTQPARAVHNVVRSCGWADARPAGALGTIDGASQRITRTRLVADITARAAPGTVVGRDGEELLVQCGDGPLAVVEYEPA
jgi:methionyl-tRNA formyltransferase